MGVLIGCRSAWYVADNLGIDASFVTIFTDSKSVIEWCRTDKTLKGFVSKRIEEIRHYNFRIKYVRSEDNSADSASRGCIVNQLKENQMWWKGPDWLSRPNGIMA